MADTRSAPTTATFVDLAAKIRGSTPRCGQVRLVAIDGPGGAGKSTFARRLSESLGGAPVISTDDFASWHDALGWWVRLEEEVLRPFANGQVARYRACDWSQRRAGSWREVPSADVVILEGVSSSRRVIRDRLSLAIWIETPREKRLARGVERDGPDMLGQWRTWMAEEDAHFVADQPRDAADVVVDGSTWPPESDRFFQIGSAD